MHVLFFNKKRVDYFYETVTKEFWDFNIAGPIVEKRIKRRFFIVNITVLSHFCLAIFVLVIFVAFPLGKNVYANLDDTLYCHIPFRTVYTA